MRVVAGTAGGRRLVTPAGDGVRPTSDRVREAVANALGSLGVLDGAHVLDAFAGSGALGIEALSRGAARATFVEPDRRARDAIAENLRTTGLAARATVVAGRVEDHLASDPAPVDVALCDPPYRFEGWEWLLRSLRASLVVCESSAAVEPPAGWHVLRARRYGGTFVVFAARELAHDDIQREHR